MPHQEIIEMVSPLPGFDDCNRYVVIAATDIAPFARLHGVDGSQPSFLTLPPQAIAPDFAQTLGDAEREKLEAEPGDPLVWMSIVRIDEDGQRVFANLRAPVVINPRRMLGLQVIFADDQLAIDHPVMVD